MSLTFTLTLTLTLNLTLHLLDEHALGYLDEALDTATEYFDDRIKGHGVQRSDGPSGGDGGGAGGGGAANGRQVLTPLRDAGSGSGTGTGTGVSAVLGAGLGAGVSGSGGPHAVHGGDESMETIENCIQFEFDTLMRVLPSVNPPWLVHIYKCLPPSRALVRWLIFRRVFSKVMALTGFIRAHEHLPHWLAAAREANDTHESHGSEANGAEPQAAQAAQAAQSAQSAQSAQAAQAAQSAQSADAPISGPGKMVNRHASMSGMIDSEVYERLEHITQKVVREAKLKLKETVSSFPVSGDA